MTKPFLPAGVLLEMGFKRYHENHPEMQDIYSITVKGCIDLDLSCETGEGSIAIWHDAEDRTVVTMAVRFAGVGTLKAFFDAIQSVTPMRSTPEQLH